MAVVHLGHMLRAQTKRRRRNDPSTQEIFVDIKRQQILKLVHISLTGISDLRGVICG